MKAIVCVKQVPDTSGKVSVKPDGTLDRASMATITNLDGEVVQHIEYVPFGEVFVEERNNIWNTQRL